jgi:hypothetical protein
MCLRLVAYVEKAAREQEHKTVFILVEVDY